MRQMIALLVLLLIACGPETSPPVRPTPPSCVPGRVESCPCGGGASGTQICERDGTFGACTCPDAAGIDGSASDDATGADAVDACSVDACAPGSRNLCTCPDGYQFFVACTDLGTFTACSCDGHTMPDAQVDAAPVVACDAGQTRCGNACARLGSDVTNCGACGVACDAGMICVSGFCYMR